MGKGKRKLENTGRIPATGTGFLYVLFFAAAFLLWGGKVKASDTSKEILEQYEEYQAVFASIENTEELEEKGYHVLEDQIFPLSLETFEEEELLFVPALEKNYRRLAVFLTDPAGKVLFKTNRLEANNRIPGQLRQPVTGLESVAFKDANRDGKKDIIFIADCVNDKGVYAGLPYRVGDVLFQSDKSFYRDWRISDKINRFEMNKSPNQIVFFSRDGVSTEFLYTASTLEELLENGFTVIDDMCYTREFEKLGRLQVVPGTFRMAWYDVFMIYLVNARGEIVWSLQPMGDYDNLYALKGINGRDVDGDGLKDLVILARYSVGDISKEQIVETKCSIYYQRTGGFERDTGFEAYYLCKEGDTMEHVVQKIREYWGWQVEK